MRKISDEELRKILNLHEKWLRGGKDGVRADLSWTNLSDMDLSHVNLIGANLDFSVLAIYCNAYSSYLEATAPFKLGGCDWEASIGAVPFATTFYGDANGFDVTHVGIKATKDIKITDSFSVPVFAQVAANPSTEKAYLVVGFTLQP